MIIKWIYMLRHTGFDKVCKHTNIDFWHHLLFTHVHCTPYSIHHVRNTFHQNCCTQIYICWVTAYGLHILTHSTKPQWWHNLIEVHRTGRKELCLHHLNVAKCMHIVWIENPFNTHSISFAEQKSIAIACNAVIHIYSINVHAITHIHICFYCLTRWSLVKSAF